MRSISSLRSRPVWPMMMMMLCPPPGAPRHRRHVHDAIHIDVEGDEDIGHAPGRRGHAREQERAKQVVALGYDYGAIESVCSDYIKTVITVLTQSHHGSRI